MTEIAPVTTPCGPCGVSVWTEGHTATLQLLAASMCSTGCGCDLANTGPLGVDMFFREPGVRCTGSSREAKDGRELRVSQPVSK